MHMSGSLTIPDSTSMAPSEAAISTGMDEQDRDDRERDDALSNADRAVSRKDLLDLLDNHYSDAACAKLCQAIRELPCRDVADLQDLVNRISNCPRSKVVSSDDWRRAIALFDLEALKCLYTIVIDLLLQELTVLSAHTEYWRSRLDHPASYYMQKGPLHWWRSSPRPRALVSGGLRPWLGYVNYLQRNEIGEILKGLEAFQQGFIAEIGRMYNTLHHLKQISSFESGIEPFAPAVETLFKFLTAKKVRRASGPFKFLRVLSDTVVAIPEFKLRFRYVMQNLKPPSHLRRHWFTYTVLATGAVIAGRQMYTSRDMLWAWVARSQESFMGFFQENLVRPVSSIYQRIFGRTRELSASVDSLQQSRAALASMLLEFGQITADEGAAAEGKTVEQYRAELPARAAAGDMNIVMTRYNKEIATPIRSVVRGELARGMLVQVNHETHVALMHYVSIRGFATAIVCGVFLLV